MEEKTDALPPIADFSAWYNEILRRAGIMDVRYPVKGLYVWYPHGFAIRKNTYNRLRAILDEDHQETMFPLLIPDHEFNKEAEHIKGFEEEVYWVTHGGLSELDVRLALRPTSETSIYPMYALWIRSHADLPLKLYQVVNTFRYETKHTRPLIRLREITSFKEAHTVHCTWEEAAEQVEEAIRLYTQFYTDLGVPVLISKRPDWDKFPGADYTIAVDTIMPDGRTLQIGTAHHLGTHFSRTFDIRYEDRHGEQQLAYQTCYGISERCIAAVISVHGDDTGLVLPPLVAPVQVVIIPIIIGKRGDEVMGAAEALRSELKALGIRAELDTRDMRPGAKYYHWELHGVPLRLEIGPRDIDAGTIMAVDRFKQKKQIRSAAEVAPLLEEFGRTIAERAAEANAGRITICQTSGEVKEAVRIGVAVASWCGERACADTIEAETDAALLGSELRGPHTEGIDGSGCLICGKEGTAALIGRSY
ncbi:MAG: proline--tRNA ligase [Methanocalculus sp. MSAO_Arc1]|uniref:proline--tRNA ligase n=1 Tax=Methanocalculus TaxID=71151 RepID=UPI000FF1AFA8|nr:MULTISPECIES: proline--tRNA ligase [unclassified Methanocalculus]MCP1662426.1 prolyl-tRNA synthetase [Methanocalculus sp. AMF5]RQD79490.1 MAG: proline--tRNA ligase [Methanocalculus sp. MSAO_Arc1]